ncbi:hypothetical protein Tco_1290642, partial [Tanacetum coccineum]
MLSEAQGVSLRITSSMRVKIGWDGTLAQKPVIMGASHVLKDDCRNCIPLSSKALPRRVWGLHVADSQTGNCLKDSFTPLETIQRFQSTIGRRFHSSSKGGFEPEGR